MKYLYFVLILMVSATLTLQAQHHESNWVSKTATDTTIVRCWNDSVSMISYPPGSMTGMMFPDSIFCGFDKLHLDSLTHPHDSTVIGWYRLQIGSDSMMYDMMNDSGMGGNNMMQFMQGVFCELYWDSLSTDSVHRDWHPTGVQGWNGTQWISMADVQIDGRTLSFSTTRQYSAFALVGTQGVTVGVGEEDGIVKTFSLSQNYPNPFNPTTTIRYTLSATSRVSVKIFDVLGVEISTVVDRQVMERGEHVVKYDASDLATGVYFYRLQSDNFTDTKKMVVLR